MFTEQIAKVRALALTAKTAIYNEDAMTAIELAGVTACKVNQCVDAINEMLDFIEKITIETSIGYNASDESVTI